MSAPRFPRPRVDATWTVNDVLRHHPAAARVFNGFGVDACCGGAQSLDAAAREADVDVGALLTALHMAASAREGEGA